MVEFRKVKPLEIEAESFKIIEHEFESQTGKAIDDFDPAEFEIIRRVIHTTGDFSFAESLYFSKNGIQKAIKSLKAGRGIYGDVSMVTSGVSKPYAAKYRNEVFSLVHDKVTAERAKAEGITRADAAILSLQNKNVGVIAIGNAPTALIRCVNLATDQKLDLDVIIGVPVGFVNAEESKQYLIESGLDCISIVGRRGGSPIAAAIVNALYRLADAH